MKPERVFSLLVGQDKRLLRWRGASLGKSRDGQDQCHE